MMNILVALLIYPGILTVVTSGMLLAFAGGVPFPRRFMFAGGYRTSRGIAILISLALLIFAVALLPVPFHPMLGRWPVGMFLLVWSLIEVACLIPLLPGFFSRLPLVVRAASRAAQLGIAGRAVFWIAAVAGMLTGSSMIELPGRILALIAGLMALPAAAGLAIFGPEQSMAPSGASGELDEATQALLPFIRNIQAAVFVLVLAASIIPPAWLSGPQAFAGVGCLIGLVLLVGFVLTQLVGRPRLTLPMGLHWCWRRVLPLAFASLVYGMIV